MTDGLDLFGGLALDEVPESNDLPKGEYPNCVIETVKAQRTKNDNGQGIGVTFKDMSEDGFGQTAFQWISFPVEANRAQYLLRDLKRIGVTGDKLLEFARSVKGSDPVTCEVDFNRINSILADSKGNSGTVNITEYDKKSGGKGRNIEFIPNEDDGFAQAEAAGHTETSSESAPADTSGWFGN